MCIFAFVGPEIPFTKATLPVCFHDNMCDFYKSCGSFFLKDVAKPATFHLPVSLLFFLLSYEKALFKTSVYKFSSLKFQ